MAKKKIVEEEVKEEGKIETPQPVEPAEQFDPSLPESKQRHLR